MVEFSDPATQASWQAICEAALSNYPHPTDFDADLERVKAAIRRRDAEVRLEFAREAARRHGGMRSIIEVAEAMNHFRPIEARAKARRQAEGGESCPTSSPES